MDSEQLTDELNFRVAVALHGINSDFDRGIISGGEARTAVKSLADTAVGLVNNEVFKAIGDASERFKTYKGYDVRFGKVDGRLHGTIRVCGNGALIRFRDAEILRSPQYHTDAEVDADAAATQGSVMERIKMMDMPPW